MKKLLGIEGKKKLLGASFILTSLISCGDPGQFQLDQSSIDFGEVFVSQSSTLTQVLPVVGDEVLKVKNIVIENSQAFQVDPLTTTCQTNKEYSAGESCTVGVTFSPKMAGVQASKVYVRYQSDGDEFSTNINLKGVGVSQLEVNPTAVNFASTKLTKEKRTRVSVKNISGSDISLGEIRILDQEKANFFFDDTESSCVQGKKLKSSEACEIEVAYVPQTQETSHSADLAVSFSNGLMALTIQAPLKGTPVLDCQVNSALKAAEAKGVQDAIAKMNEETALGKAAGEALTRQNGIDQTYRASKERAYASEYENSFNSSYRSGVTDGQSAGVRSVVACNDGAFVGQEDGLEEGEVEGVASGYDEGYLDGNVRGQAEGYAPGRQNGIDVCQKNFFLSYPDLVGDIKRNSCRYAYDGVCDEHDQSCLFGTDTSDCYEEFAQNQLKEFAAPKDAIFVSTCAQVGYGKTYTRGKYDAAYDLAASKNSEFLNGKIEGERKGRLDGEAQGETDGTNDGYTAGFESGKKEGELVAYESCYADAYEDAFLFAFESAFVQSYPVGYSDGYEDGFNTTFAVGELDGKDFCESTYNNLTKASFALSSKKNAKLIGSKKFSSYRESLFSVNGKVVLSDIKNAKLRLLKPHFKATKVRGAKKMFSKTNKRKIEKALNSAQSTKGQLRVKVLKKMRGKMGKAKMMKVIGPEIK